MQFTVTVPFKVKIFLASVKQKTEVYTRANRFAGIVWATMQAMRSEPGEIFSTST